MSKESISEAVTQAFGPFEGFSEFVHEVQEVEIPKGFVVYIPGDRATSLYIVIKGLVSISRVTPNGRGVILDYVSPNQFFGEEALLNQGETEGRWEIAEAKQETRLCVVKRSLMQRFLFPNIGVMQRLMEVCLEKRQRLSSRLEILLHREVRVRLAALFLDLGQRYGVPQSDGSLLIDLNIPHHELARFIGATRETISATISSFKSMGYLAGKGRRLVLAKPALLEALL